PPAPRAAPAGPLVLGDQHPALRFAGAGGRDQVVIGRAGAVHHVQPGPRAASGDHGPPQLGHGKPYPPRMCTHRPTVRPASGRPATITGVTEPDPGVTEPDPGVAASDTGGPDIRTTAGKIADLRRRIEEAVHAGSARAVENQHARGKKTARERI